MFFKNNFITEPNDNKTFALSNNKHLISLFYEHKYILKISTVSNNNLTNSICLIHSLLHGRWWSPALALQSPVSTQPTHCSQRRCDSGRNIAAPQSVLEFVYDHRGTALYSHQHARTQTDQAYLCGSVTPVVCLQQFIITRQPPLYSSVYFFILSGTVRKCLFMELCLFDWKLIVVSPYTNCKHS